MRLNPHTLANLAIMICGDNEPKMGKPFPYRSSSRLTAFFTNCDLYRVHDGSTRRYWVAGVLKELDQEQASLPDLPSDSLVRVITELLDAEYFDQPDDDRDAAMIQLNKTLARDSLVVFLDDSKHCHLRHDGTGVTSASIPQRPRPLTADEKIQHDRLAAFLDRASEDDFTEKVLVPLFQRLGYHRVNALGHKEKVMEFGKDLWMKFMLPTGHWIYFCAQIKRVKIDAKGTSGGNVTEVLNQARMALDHPIFDPDVNRNVLLDHIYIISAAEITRAAQHWIAQHLDKEKRRHLIFMDRGEFLTFAARIVADLPVPTTAKPIDDHDIPFESLAPSAVWITVRDSCTQRRVVHRRGRTPNLAKPHTVRQAVKHPRASPRIETASYRVSPNR